MTKLAAAFKALARAGISPSLSEELLLRNRSPEFLGALVSADSQNISKQVGKHAPKNFFTALILENPEAALYMTPDLILGRAKQLLAAGVPWEDVPGFLKSDVN